VHKKLGASIRSDVFVAKQVEDGQKVVVKFFSPSVPVTRDQVMDFCERFQKRPDSGLQTRSCLVNIGLEDVAERLAAAGKLAGQQPGAEPSTASR